MRGSSWALVGCFLGSRMGGLWVYVLVREKGRERGRREEDQRLWLGGRWLCSRLGLLLLRRRRRRVGSMVWVWVSGKLGKGGGE